MNSIKVFLPHFATREDNNILLTNAFLNRLNELNIPFELVRDMNQFKPNDIVVFRFGADIYNWSLAHTEKCSQELVSIISKIENIGCVCYPSSELMKYYENKVQLYNLFTDKGVKIPDSFLIYNKAEYDAKRDQLMQCLPVILKVCFSCSSNNIQQAYTIEQLDDIMSTYFSTNDSVILIQKKIHFTREARLTYIGDNIYHSYYRIKSSADKVSGATAHGSSISFTVDNKKLQPFIRQFVNKTKFYMGGIDIVWENDDLDSEPYVLEVSPIYDVNPPPIGEFADLPYSMFKKSSHYLPEKQRIYQHAANSILDYIIEINSRPILLVDIDCTISDSEPRIKKWAQNEDYKKYEHIILDKPIENSITVLNALSKLYKIIIITARKSFNDGLRATKDWLYMHDYSYHQLILVNELREKTLFYRNKYTDTLIDDFTTNHHDCTTDDLVNLKYFKDNGYQFIKYDNSSVKWLNIEETLYKNHQNIGIIEELNHFFLDSHVEILPKNKNKKILVVGLDFNQIADNNLQEPLHFYKRKYQFKSDTSILKLNELCSCTLLDEKIKINQSSICINFLNEIENFSNNKCFDVIIVRFMFSNDKKLFIINSLLNSLSKDGCFIVEHTNNAFINVEKDALEYICKTNNLEHQTIKKSIQNQSVYIDYLNKNA